MQGKIAAVAIDEIGVTSFRCRASLRANSASRPSNAFSSKMTEIEIVRIITQCRDQQLIDHFAVLHAGSRQGNQTGRGCVRHRVRNSALLDLQRLTLRNLL